MAHVITDKCALCGDCLDVCPIGAVAEGETKYVIDDTCCDFAECVIVCPEEAIISVDEFDAIQAIDKTATNAT